LRYRPSQEIDDRKHKAPQTSLPPSQPFNDSNKYEGSGYAGSVNFSFIASPPCVLCGGIYRGKAFHISAHRQGISNMKTRIFITLKNGVLDPQGKAIHHALEGLGFSGVNDVRAGRMIEIDHEDGVSKADLESMCSKLLANMVIENFEIEQN
jgi:phosphoribosylformylglycinamidine synthase subunit PurS